jgi:hypothetical protein
MRSFVICILHQILGQADREEEMGGVEKRNYKSLFGRRAGKRPQSRWENDVKLDTKDSVWVLIHPPPDTVQWRAVVKTVMNLRVP